MSTADYADLIREAEAALAEARADVERLRAKLAGEQKDAQAHRLTAEDGRNEARRRIAERTGRTGKADSDASAPQTAGEGTATGVAAGRAEARPRYPR